MGAFSQWTTRLDFHRYPAAFEAGRQSIMYNNTHPQPEWKSEPAPIFWVCVCVPEKLRHAPARCRVFAPARSSVHVLFEQRSDLSMKPVKFASCFFAATVDAHDCIFDVAEESLGVLFRGRRGVRLLSDVPMDMGWGCFHQIS